MNASTLEAKVNDFLAQKRLAVAGVSRNDTQHPTAHLIDRRLEGHRVRRVPSQPAHADVRG
jgi:hypothetical protein